MYRKVWVQTTIAFLLIATLLGAFLRYLMVNPMEGVTFRHLLHTHSHIAFLGWIFNALFIGLVYSFIPKNFEGAKKYHTLFLGFQLSVLGMLFSFPFQGYGAVSIAFSTLHVVLSVVLAVFFVRDKKKIYKERTPLSLHFALGGLFFLLLSSLGPFALGYGMAKEISGAFNQLAIFFYLHFQYDGWFTFAVFALFFRLLEKGNIKYGAKPARMFFILLLLSCTPAYAGSTLWAHPPAWVYLVAVAAALAQLVGLGYFVASIKGKRRQIKSAMPGWTWFLLWFAFACFAFKTLLQVLGTVPFMADMAYNIRNFLIFYLHVIFLGFVSIFLFAWFEKHQLYRLRSTHGIVFLAGFIVSQLLIVLQPLLLLAGGYSMPYYNEILFYVSLLMPFSLLFNSVQDLVARKSCGSLLIKNTGFSAN